MENIFEIKVHQRENAQRKWKKPEKRKWGQISTNSSQISPTETRNKGHQREDERIILVFNHTWNYFFPKNFEKEQRASNQIKITNRGTIYIFFSFLEIYYNEIIYSLLLIRHWY